MNVYIKTKGNNIYASPVFAEFGESWSLKCVVLDEGGEYLHLIDIASKTDKGLKFNIFFIDESMPSEWISKNDAAGFEEIISNQSIVETLLSGGKVSIKGLNCINLYELPLKVIDEFEIKNEKDIETFVTVTWGLHDALIEKIEKDGNNLIVYLDTTWQKHIIMTFVDIIEVCNLDQIGCILDSEILLEENLIKWLVIGGFNKDWDNLEGEHFVTAKQLKWKLIID